MGIAKSGPIGRARKALAFVVRRAILVEAMNDTSGLVLFDFDGTLADSLAVALDVYNTVAPRFAAPRISADDAELRRMNPRDALRASAIPMWKVPRLMSAIRSGMRDRMDMVPLFPGMDVAVRDLACAGFRCGIVSSNARDNIEPFLARNGMDEVEILGTGTSLFGKAAALRKVLRRERVEAARAFYVGDEVRDVAAAAEVGMRSVAVSWGYADRGALVSEGPDLLVDRPDELAPRLIDAFHGHGPRLSERQ
jgi:phosphoglycolate phosphatase